MTEVLNDYDEQFQMKTVLHRTTKTLYKFCLFVPQIVLFSRLSENSLPIDLHCFWIKHLFGSYHLQILYILASNDDMPQSY